MPIADYFSSDYRSAREHFCAAAERAGAHLKRYLLPKHLGPQGESLSVDVARLGPEGATALPEREITFIGLEFGTRPVLDVLTALRADHWVYARAPHDAERRAAAQHLMRQGF
jgi:hypothetical protein